MAVCFDVFQLHCIIDAFMEVMPLTYQPLARR